MKKLFITIGIIGSLSVNGHAGLISHTDYTSGATITAAGQNANENVIFNEFNGNIDNSNIKSGAVIAVNKLVALTANSVVTTDSSGFLNTSSATVRGTLTVNSSMTVVGTLTFSSPTVNGIVGTTTNNDAGTGLVGEYQHGVQSSVVNAAPTGTFMSISTVTLTAGDWDVTGVCELNTNSATIGNTPTGCAVSSAAGAASTDHIEGDNLLYGIAAISPQNKYTAAVPNVRVSITTSTPYYVKGVVNYTGGPPQWLGRISARRVR